MNAEKHARAADNFFHVVHLRNQLKELFPDHLIEVVSIKVGVPEIQLDLPHDFLDEFAQLNEILATDRKKAIIRAKTAADREAERRSEVGGQLCSMGRHGRGRLLWEAAKRAARGNRD